MKSFFKATRAGLVIMLALCMVMSFVTVVSAADAVIGNITQTAPTGEGYYTVTVPVSGIETGGDATILIHDTGEVIDKYTIKYVNQEPTTEGAYTFTAILKGGGIHS